MHGSKLLNIIWFKRDLRIEDHEALFRASENKPVLPLYILEPDLWRQPDMSYRHYAFLQDCIKELDEELGKLGQKLIIKIGSVIDILNKINKNHLITGLFSHQETWNGWTYDRDKVVRKWCKSQDIIWYEYIQNGVIRCLKNRNGWAARWKNQMKKPTFTRPLSLNPVDEKSDNLPSYSYLGLVRNGAHNLQRGGRSRAVKLLRTFLSERGEHYTKELSSPLTAFESCSRMSPHLAFGTISIREVFQAYAKRCEIVKSLNSGEKGKWPSALRSFSGRLHWHCHFIQKLEDDPSIEFLNMHPAYNQIRKHDFNNDYFQAWKFGLTGYPMVDACMRSLIETGWLNFRMRAMLMSFASYHLWLDWRKPALYLANLFTDYEPGIHYSQIQMQSGTTGINAIRIYNPIKQGVDHDPHGIFIRRWVAELKDIDKSIIHTPWESVSDLNGYPLPIVDEQKARKYAASIIYGIRKNNNIHMKISSKILKTHGSRRINKQKKILNKKIKKYTQGELPL